MNKHSIAFFSLGVIGLLLFRDQDFIFMRIISILIMIASLVIYLSDAHALDTKSLSERIVKLFKKEKVNLKVRGTNKERAFIRVQNALKNGKVFVSIEDDGIYIRLAGNENEGEAFSSEKVKVYSYER